MKDDEWELEESPIKRTEDNYLEEWEEDTGSWKGVF